jgi:hypothetical protein
MDDCLCTTIPLDPTSVEASDKQWQAWYGRLLPDWLEWRQVGFHSPKLGMLLIIQQSIVSPGEFNETDWHKVPTVTNTNCVAQRCVCHMMKQDQFLNWLAGRNLMRDGTHGGSLQGVG